MIGFTVNPETPEQVHKKKMLNAISSAYSEHFNRNVVPSLGLNVVDKTGALGKFTFPLNNAGIIELTFTVVFPSGFVSRENELERQEAEKFLTEYVSQHVDDIKGEIKNGIAQLEATS